MDLTNRVYCINLKHRKDRKIHFTRMARKKQFKFTFYTPEINRENPEQGRTSSHIAVLKQALKNDLPYVLIFEDDAKVLTPKIFLKQDMPDDWEMLYLGGAIQHEYAKNTSQQIIDNPNWRRVSCLLTHAYIIKKSLYKQVITDLSTNMDIPLDQYYCTKIHPYHNCYMLTTPYVIQRPSYSDIEKKEVDYTYYLGRKINIDNHHDNNEDIPFMLSSVPVQTENEITKLKLDEISNDQLPSVSIITPTYNHRDYFPIVIRDFFKLDYPKNKLEWIIVDDSEEEQKVNTLLPYDPRIKYVYCRQQGIRHENHLTVSKKRNIGVMHASNDVIIHMDDDDHYFPSSVLIRVMTLMSYPEKKCVGCNTIGIFDLKTNKSYLADLLNMDNKAAYLSEASMAYYKSFWEEQNFNEKAANSESEDFIKGRYDKVITLPHQFVMTALLHDKNLVLDTKKKVLMKDTKKLIEPWSAETREYIEIVYKATKEF